MQRGKKLFSNRKKLEKVIVKSCMHVNLELLLCTVFVLDIHIWPRSTLVAQTSPCGKGRHLAGNVKRASASIVSAGSRIQRKAWHGG